MKFSIVIPSYNNKELTRKCLEAIWCNSKGHRYEIIVVDDCSTDGAREFLKEQKDITLILNEKNQGFAKNNNSAAGVAKGDTLIFLNNDTEVQPGWLRAIENVFKTEKNIGAVGVKLLFPNGTLQHAGVVIALDHTPRHIYREKPADYPGANKQRDFKIVTAACIAIPSKIYKKYGGFDEEFKNGLEDVDLCLRLHHAGLRIIYTPKAVVVHHESVAPNRFKSNDHNADLYMSRWKNEESDEHKFMREDGLSSWVIMLSDLRQLSWGPNKYKTRPNWVKFARFIYIPTQKLCMLFSLIFTGDFKLLMKKVKKVMGYSEG